MTALADLAVEMRAILPLRASTIKILTHIEPSPCKPLLQTNYTLVNSLRFSYIPPPTSTSDIENEVSDHRLVNGDQISRVHLEGSEGRRRSLRGFPEDGERSLQEIPSALSDRSINSSKTAVDFINLIQITPTAAPTNASQLSDTDSSQTPLDPRPTVESTSSPSTAPTTSSGLDQEESQPTGGEGSNSLDSAIVNTTLTEGGVNGTSLRRKRHNESEYIWNAELSPEKQLSPVVDHLIKNVTYFHIAKYYINLMTCMQGNR